MLQNLLSRVVEIITSEMPAAKKSRRGNGKKAHLRHRSLQLESLEARELLSVSPMLPQEFQSETELVAPMSMSMQAAASTTLSGVTLNVTAANYATLNAQYDFANITSITGCNITANGVTHSGGFRTSTNIFPLFVHRIVGL